MPSPQLTALGRYMAGEFDNREQAIADPAWYVHLRLWQRPVSLFTEDSLTLYAEQANILKLDQPYRPRIIRLQERSQPQPSLHVQYYMIKDPALVQGAGSHPERLQNLTLEQIELLPGCTLEVTQQQTATNSYHFQATPPADCICRFTFRGQIIQVSLGFEASPEAYLTYDKGIDIDTGKPIWGALLGPYRYTKCQDFSADFPL
jgi:CpeT/CpcT family (DUF1001)